MTSSTPDPEFVLLCCPECGEWTAVDLDSPPGGEFPCDRCLDYAVRLRRAEELLREVGEL